MEELRARQILRGSCDYRKGDWNQSIYLRLEDADYDSNDNDDDPDLVFLDDRKSLTCNKKWGEYRYGIPWDSLATTGRLGQSAQEQRLFTSDELKVKSPPPVNAEPQWRSMNDNGLSRQSSRNVEPHAPRASVHRGQRESLSTYQGEAAAGNNYALDELPYGEKDRIVHKASSVRPEYTRWERSRPLKHNGVALPPIAARPSDTDASEFLKGIALRAREGSTGAGHNYTRSRLPSDGTARGRTGSSGDYIRVGRITTSKLKQPPGNGVALSDPEHIKQRKCLMYEMQNLENRHTFFTKFIDQLETKNIRDWEDLKRWENGTHVQLQAMLGPDSKYRDKKLALVLGTKQVKKDKAVLTVMKKEHEQRMKQLREQCWKLDQAKRDVLQEIEDLRVYQKTGERDSNIIRIALLRKVDDAREQRLRAVVTLQNDLQNEQDQLKLDLADELKQLKLDAEERAEHASELETLKVENQKLIKEHKTHKVNYDKMLAVVNELMERLSVLRKEKSEYESALFNRKPHKDCEPDEPISLNIRKVERPAL
eukprot:scpid26659/ scgid2618/ 